MVDEMLDKLKELQDVLAEKYTIESELKEIPRSLNTKNELVSRLKKSFIDRNAKFEETRQNIADLKIQMTDAERARETTEGKMVDISTQREYEALSKEIRDYSEKEQNYRKDLQREEKLLQEMEQAIEREEALIKEQEEELREEQAKIEEETKKRNTLLEKLEKKELSITPELDEEIVFKFKRIIRSKQGKGIVPLSKGVCSGCNMILPLQFVNDVRSGAGVKFCPYCSMILFYQETGDDDIIESMVYEDTSALFDDDAYDGSDSFDDDDDFDNDFSDDESSEDSDESDDDEDEDDEDEEDDDEDESDDEEAESSVDEQSGSDIDGDIDDDELDEESDEDMLEEEIVE